MRKLISALVLFLGFQTYALAQMTLPAPSLWQNQRGSTLQIDSADPFFGIRGTFINRARGYKCQNIPYPVTGNVGPSINFHVMFAQCQSIATWTVVQMNAGVMNTVWTLSVTGGGSTSGRDMFRQIR
jgi:hypothetical protein